MGNVVLCCCTRSDVDVGVEAFGASMEFCFSGGPFILCVIEEEQEDQEEAE
jgi:hypothetical protein